MDPEHGWGGGGGVGELKTENLGGVGWGAKDRKTGGGGSLFRHRQGADVVSRSPQSEGGFRSRAAGSAR